MRISLNLYLHDIRQINQIYGNTATERNYAVKQVVTEVTFSHAIDWVTVFVVIFNHFVLTA